MKGIKSMENKKEILMQHNNLIKSKYNFTSIENKLYYKILYNAQKQGANNQLMETTITVEELKGFIKKTNDYCYESIKEKLTLFQQSVLEFDYIEESGAKVKFNAQLIAPFKYSEEEQKYTIYVHEVLYNHLTNAVKLQEEGYSAINLSILFNFRGAYTQRFYTLFRMWSRQNKEVEIGFTIEELRTYLKLKPGTYPSYRNLKQRVISGALEEINKVGNMQVSIKEEQKKGRSVNKIIFTVKDFEPRKYFDDSEEFVEETVLLNDGGEKKEFQQKAININAFTEIKEAPAVAPAEALELNKFVNYTDDSFFTPKIKEEFIIYCHDNLINFSDLDTNRILKESQQAFITNKGINKINTKSNLKYFLGIFKNKIDEDLKRFSIDNLIVGQAPAEEINNLSPGAKALLENIIIE